MSLPHNGSGRLVPASRPSVVSAVSAAVTSAGVPVSQTRLGTRSRVLELLVVAGLRVLLGGVADLRTKLIRQRHL